jgi:hypothetical protein
MDIYKIKIYTLNPSIQDSISRCEKQQRTLRTFTGFS